MGETFFRIACYSDECIYIPFRRATAITMTCCPILNIWPTICLCDPAMCNDDLLVSGGGMVWRSGMEVKICYGGEEHIMGSYASAFFLSLHFPLSFTCFMSSHHQLDLFRHFCFVLTSSMV